jgi:histone demethylase JARID1
LQRIRVRLPEGDALRFLIERTVRWQHRVQQGCTDGMLEEVARMAKNGNGKAKHCQRISSSHPTLEINGYFFPEHQSTIPMQVLGPELEELMVEGFLLQVTLPETEQLYTSLLHCLLPPPKSPSEKDHHHHHHSHKGSPHPTQNGGSCHRKEKEVNGQSKRTKRRKESSDSSRHRDQAKKSRKKRSKTHKDKSHHHHHHHPQQHSELISTNTSPIKSSSSPLNTVSSEPAVPSAPSDSEEEDYSLCAAPWCREPEGDEVDWVQCDGHCNQWFHQVCVGLSADQAESDDYICISCTQPDYHKGE